MKDSIDSAIFLNHSTYYAVAYRNNVEVRRLVRELSGIKVETDDDVDVACAVNAAIQRHAMIVVVFSALTLEAFINFYAIEHLSKRFLERHLDRLGPASKWLIIPRLVCGKQLDTNGQAYEGLQRLFKTRNELVHYKGKITPMSQLRDRDYSYVEEKDAEDAISTVWQAVTELSRLDTRVTSSWLEDAQTSPFV